MLVTLKTTGICIKYSCRSGYCDAVIIKSEREFRTPNYNPKLQRFVFIKSNILFSYMKARFIQQPNACNVYDKNITLKARKL